jgi:multidrug efflux pump subunit AcrB
VGVQGYLQLLTNLTAFGSMSQALEDLTTRTTRVVLKVEETVLVVALLLVGTVVGLSPVVGGTFFRNVERTRNLLSPTLEERTSVPDLIFPVPTVLG